MNNRIPDEILLHTFSFLSKKPELFSPLSLVCKDWYRVTNKDALWLQLIRPECQNQCNISGSSAKEFYKNNIDARVDTYYLIGSPVKTADFNWQGSPRTITVNESSLLKAFPQSEKIQILHSREEAIKWADVLSKVDQTALDNSIAHIYHYRPIFTIQINEATLTPSLLDVQNESFYKGCGRESLSDQCFEISLSEVVMQYSVFYKTGVLQTRKWESSQEKHHELILNQQINQTNQIKPEQEQQKKKCNIQ